MHARFIFSPTFPHRDHSHWFRSHFIILVCFVFLLLFGTFFSLFFFSHQMIKMCVCLCIYWKSIKIHSSPDQFKRLLIIDVVNPFILTMRLHFFSSFQHCFLRLRLRLHWLRLNRHMASRHLTAALFSAAVVVIIHWNKWRHNCMYINVFEMANKRYKL